ncbi:hypothetical protein DICVIV_10346 [Dictyocaulus viviparus]|uniref:Uncharacterized protein n=1 Tax=Dictyocaulus viviparus TaxID=29172 RepID=A0A0D8XG85_DICVI|nr:hypothetical protein DICVIV_10346 [Dictyocaulus viviparus]
MCRTRIINIAGKNEIGSEEKPNLKDCFSCILIYKTFLHIQKIFSYQAYYRNNYVYLPKPHTWLKSFIRNIVI